MKTGVVSNPMVTGSNPVRPTIFLHHHSTARKAEHEQRQVEEQREAPRKSGGKRLGRRLGRIRAGPRHRLKRGLCESPGTTERRSSKRSHSSEGRPDLRPGCPPEKAGEIHSQAACR